MGTKYFSCKEAFSHGFKTTKKYFGFIICVACFYIVFQVISGQLHSAAGAPMTRDSVRRLYQDPAAADKLYQHLQGAGYINAYGQAQAKLQNTVRAADVILPEDFSFDRERIFQHLNQARYRLPFPKLIFYLLSIGLWAIGVIISIGWLKITLLLSRDEAPLFSEIFAHGRLFLPYFLASFAYGLAVAGGAILFIIPGIIVGVMLSLYSYFIVDQDMGPMESLKASRALTKGARWKLFCFYALLILVNLAGALCLIIGLLFTIPASSIATAYIYDQLRTPEDAVVA